MKWIENHIEIVWALLVAWLISFGVVCECVEPSGETTAAVVGLLALGIVLFTIIIRYYKYNPKGQEAVKESEEAERERRLRKEIRKLDRKAYRRQCLEREEHNSDNPGFIPMS